ncbi:MAG: hypothetical protein AB9879_10035 [Methanothrix sp.]
MADRDLINFEGLQWTVVDDPAPSEPSLWTVKDGMLQHLTNIYRTDSEYEFWQGTHIIAGSPTWNDYELSFDIKSGDNDGIGAIIRYQDKNNYYRFIMLADSANRGPFQRIEKFVNGRRKILAEIKEGYVPNQTYRVQFKAFGNQLALHINGKRVLSAEDSSFRSGKIGFLAYANYPLFIWNIRINDSTKWHKGKKIIWAAQDFKAGKTAFIDGISNNIGYTAIKRTSTDSATNLLMLMLSAVLGNRETNVEIDSEGNIISAALPANSKIDVPPNIDPQHASIEESIAALDSAKIDAFVECVYTTYVSQTAWIYIDELIINDKPSELKGWVRLFGPDPEATSNMFILLCQAAALRHRVRFANAKDCIFGITYIWSKN